MKALMEALMEALIEALRAVLYERNGRYCLASAWVLRTAQAAPPLALELYQRHGVPLPSRMCASVTGARNVAPVMPWGHAGEFAGRV